MTALRNFMHVTASGDRDENRRIFSALPLEGDSAEERASGLLNRLGCRMWMADGSVVIGYWPDLDGPELRAAIRFVSGAVELRSLEHADVTEDRTARRVPLRKAGEPLYRWLNRANWTQGSEMPEPGTG